VYEHVAAHFHGPGRRRFGVRWSHPDEPANPQRSADSARQIAHAHQANAVLMHKDTWNSRTDILKENQVKDARIEQVNHD